MSFWYRVLATALGGAVGQTALQIVAAFGFDIPQRIANAVITNATPTVISLIGWAIVASLALVGLLLGPKIEEFVWSISKPPRSPMTEFLAEAEKRGVSFTGHNYDLLELAKELRQAALNGAIEIYGRYTRHKSDELNQNEPLQPIPREHWATFQIDANTLRRIDVENQERGRALDNHQITTYNPSQQNWRDGSYFDLYTNTVSARRWLRRNIHKINAGEVT